MNDKAVYRTAPATPGLLKRGQEFGREKNVLEQNPNYKVIFLFKIHLVLIYID